MAHVLIVPDHHSYERTCNDDGTPPRGLHRFLERHVTTTKKLRTVQQWHLTIHCRGNWWENEREQALCGSHRTDNNYYLARTRRWHFDWIFRDALTKSSAMRNSPWRYRFSLAMASEKSKRIYMRHVYGSVLCDSKVRWERAWIKLREIITWPCFFSVIGSWTRTVS